MKAFDFIIVATDSETNVPVVIAHGWNTGGSEYLTVHPEGEETYFALKEMMGRKLWAIKYPTNQKESPSD